ncbi:8-oxo-dGTP diphosphatase [Yamadazyma tenuis]|uniref:Nudix hydrolase domain-containing protein n=1 Tax=Candida tenuis (strain ATCC 10573 / BCRC 21748 / CBS 615 / JCM 9827 / NBRC 10315 / NRRL Y-1498 / VKM Y-70) TaxID=590646 RepID=G3AZ99_CANTC|nr:uncharacterized protein CANTEDRAFT_112905 [Yamadazyma tenuis ATCC 10573]XP_006684865.1 uncharacterized protein CANTEDRAFT_112905 [Yamadazyma tenuis ATCC 10573]EGV66290.1 hypothetical protein CANTEDRAFT_112905 [Yamadazyma tenuis ATCC 10573]EGV66291.1 hypothetical protein CANTEDRAFT_112905 [Yamadazyma tenuis ATCC 10573]WEJ95614.1 8-oxo-dGTP diphosphatase [Yamadazyma tenuis]
MSESPLNTITKYNFPHYDNQPTSVWNRLPVSRRSAVFVLLFLGKLGELRVVLTKRSSKLRNFPGHISFPGGKSDNGLESEWHTARREMEEEIGLSANNEYLLKNFGFEIDHLNVMPSYLSRTFSAVRPCVGFMRFAADTSGADLIHNLKVNLNPGESSSVFSCPLQDFLYPISDRDSLECIEKQSFRMSWGGIPWMLRTYTFPQLVAGEASWLQEVQGLSESESESELNSDSAELQGEESQAQSEEVPQTSRGSRKLNREKWGRLGSRRHSETNEKIYDVWGLTANILHDLANVVYTNNATNSEFGQEDLIYSIWHHGNQMREKKRSPEESQLIESRSRPDDLGFGDILPRTEFLRLKQLYK